MKKIIVLIVLMFCVVANAADTKITGLVNDASPTSDDLITTVNDPGGTPANRKVTIQAFGVYLGTLFVNTVGTPANSQVGVWTGDGTLEGAASFTYDGSNLQLTGDIGSTGTPITKGWYTDLYVVNGLDVAPTASPSVTFEDSDLLGADKYAASIEVNATTVTDGAEVTDMTLYYMDAGSKTAAITIDGSDNQVEFGIDTTFQAGDIVLAELATDSVDYTKTTGSSKALTPVTDDADNFAANFTGANLYGGTFIANGTGTAQLPAITAGMHFTIITLGAIAVVVEPNASDSFLLDGVQLDDADSATNTSTAGDIIVFQYYSAAGWVATSNGWTDED